MQKIKRYDPIAKDIRALRLAMGETHAQFCKHFKVGRTTLANWEHHGPPAFGPVRAYCLLVLARLKGKRRRADAKRADYLAELSFKTRVGSGL